MLKRTLALCTLMIGSPFARRSDVRGEEPTAEASPEGGRPNLVAPTLGGLQFWTDEQFFHGWHIQRHCYTGHCRLLDDANRRHAWGPFEQCQARLDAIRRERELPPMRGKAVIALHGLIRTRHSMDGLCQYLHASGEYSVFNVNYPSTRAEVGQHAAALASIIEHLDGVEEINLISHSLGSLVIRHYLADTTDLETGRQGDPRIKRIVMMGAPNNGAELAEKFGRNKVFKTVFGAAGEQLARAWPELEARLAVPKCEFAILAGGRGDASGWNPFLSGDDDGVVGVDTTRLPGARDFAVLPLSHTFMMNDARLREYVLRFLEQGHFIAEAVRQPISAEDTSTKHETRNPKPISNPNEE